MSDLTQCNFCSLREIRRLANREGKVVSIRPSKGEMGGVNVYVHPKEVHIRAGIEGSMLHHTYFKAWFMSIGDHCTC
jgi:hypothetical protein